MPNTGDGRVSLGYDPEALSILLGKQVDYLVGLRLVKNTEAVVLEPFHADLFGFGSRHFIDPAFIAV